MADRFTDRVLLAAAVSLALAGCTGTTGTTGTSPSPTSSSAGTPGATIAPTPSTPDPTPADAAGTPISLDIDGRQVSGRLDDSATAASLIAQLPLTLSFSDHAGEEKIAILPTALSVDGAPERSGAPPLTIGYYGPDRGLVLYYEQVGVYPGIIPIGSFDDLEAVRSPLNDFTATVRLAN